MLEGKGGENTVRKNVDPEYEHHLTFIHMEPKGKSMGDSGRSNDTVVIQNFATMPIADDGVRASCEILGHDKREARLWYDVFGLPPYASIECADAFFAPCLLLALRLKRGIRFEVPISTEIAHQAQDVGFIFGTQMGLDPRIRIELGETTSIARRAAGNITGFSAGVDSWFTLKENFFKCAIPAKKLTHLLVNDVGANTSEQKKRQVAAMAASVAGESGLTLICVRSNVADVLQTDFQMTHTACNASTAHLLTSVTNTFYYSSADDYTYAGVFPTHDMAYADTILLPLLSSEAITLRSIGSTRSRVDKTREILELPSIGERLDVCVDHAHKGRKINCGSCWKCMRTELTLESLGMLSKFDAAFDLNAYRSKLARYIQEIAASNRPSDQELFILAREAGIAGSRWVHRAQWGGVRVARKLRASLSRGPASA